MNNPSKIYARANCLPLNGRKTKHHPRNSRCAKDAGLSLRSLRRMCKRANYPLYKALIICCAFKKLPAELEPFKV